MLSSISVHPRKLFQRTLKLLVLVSGSPCFCIHRRVPWACSRKLGGDVKPCALLRLRYPNYGRYGSTIFRVPLQMPSRNMLSNNNRLADEQFGELRQACAEPRSGRSLGSDPPAQCSQGSQDNRNSLPHTSCICLLPSSKAHTSFKQYTYSLTCPHVKPTRLASKALVNRPFHPKHEVLDANHPNMETVIRQRRQTHRHDNIRISPPADQLR